MLERLGNPDLIFPRLSVPFSLWGTLLAHGGWRQKLYARRQGLAEQSSIRQWLQANLSDFAQTLGWVQQEFVQVRSRIRSTETILGLYRQLIIPGNTYEIRILPSGNPEERIWRFELRSSSPESTIPIGFKLRLLTEDLQAFENNEDTATTTVDILYLEVMLEPRERLVWETEPLPEDYDREILQF